MTGSDLHRIMTDLGMAAADLRRTTGTLNDMAINLAETQSRLDGFLRAQR
jgi:hypothetical protein